MAQSILIYRCWIVWGYSLRVVIVPSFLAFAFLALWIATGTAPMYIVQDQTFISPWGGILEVAGLAVSMTVNALVTGLIVFRIFQVFQELKTPSTADDQSSRITGGGTLQRVIFIIIESGMALFSIQLTRLVVSIVPPSNFAANDTYYLIIGIHQMINGITPTIILVRVSMGLSFHDEGSMVEANIGSLRFRSDIPNPIPQNELFDEGKNDDIEIQLSDDLNISYTDGRQDEFQREKITAYIQD